MGYNHLFEWGTTLEDLIYTLCLQGKRKWLRPRAVETDTTGRKVVTVTTDCDPPHMLLLTLKGDYDYWSDDYDTGRISGWSQNSEHRRIWCADIARQMLEEGLVAADDGLYQAMDAAGSTAHMEEMSDPHVLTAAVAQIRGMRLIQSMGPTDYYETNFGGYYIPDETAQHPCRTPHLQHSTRESGVALV